MKCYKINLIRHGRTIANENGIYIGQTDYPLSEDGKAELENLRVENSYPNVSRVYSSPLTRALQTAEIIFPQTEIVVCDEMTEMNFGAFEGIALKDLLELESYHNWIKGGENNAPPNGETIQNMLQRICSGLNLIIMDMMKNNISESALVTHAGIITNILACFGLPKIEPNLIKCNYGEGFLINVTAMMWQNGGTFEIVGEVPAIYNSGYEDYNF